MPRISQPISDVAVELYNFAVNESQLHNLRQMAVDHSLSPIPSIRRLSAQETVFVAIGAARRYMGGGCFTTEHVLETALMLHREDAKACAEDKASGGKGEL
jgi:hypothetical protein